MKLLIFCKINAYVTKYDFISTDGLGLKIFSNVCYMHLNVFWKFGQFLLLSFNFLVFQSWKMYINVLYSISALFKELMASKFPK